MESLELRIFREVAHTRNISKAAENLGYVQSNVTAHIKKLEHEVDTILFIRHNKGVTLSADGEKLLRYADEIISLLDQAVSSFRSVHKQFRIGTTQTIAGYILPQCLMEYQEKSPNIHFSIHTDNPSEMKNRLAQNALDCVITNDPQNFTNAQCIFETREDLSLITPKFCASISQIWKLPIIVNNLKTCPYRKLLTDLFLRRSVPCNIIELDTVESLLNTVALGGGISLLPKYIVQDNPNINVFDVPEVEPTFIKLWIPNDSSPSDYRIFMDIIEGMQKTI